MYMYSTQPCIWRLKAEALYTHLTPSTAPTGDNPSSGEGRSTWLSTSEQAKQWFGMVKDGAGSWFKNLKDSSSKVLQGMSG